MSRISGLGCELRRAMLVACALLALPAGASEGRAESSATCSSVDYGAVATPGVEYDRALPPNPDGPTLVAFGVRVLELRDIDPVRGSYHFRGYARTTWCDPRLARQQPTGGSRERVYTGPAATQVVEDEIWYPAAFPVNQTGTMAITERTLRIQADGTVLQDLNISVSLASRFALQRFPFDTQRLELDIESFAWPAAVAQIIEDPAHTGVDPGLQLPEWTIRSAIGRVESVDRMRSDLPFSRYTLETRIERRPGFYLWKVFLPLLVIVALSWSVFWMSDESFASRSRVSATGVLTIVAYQFVFAGDLPRVGYLTILDKVMVASFGLLAVTVLQSLLISPYQTTDPSRALRLDKLSRVLFPLVYAAVLTAIWLFG